MTTIRRTVLLDCNADTAWRVLGDFGMAGVAFAGPLTDCTRDGDIRTVTFAAGPVVRERLITVDDVARRIVYAVIGGAFTHHSASMEILPNGDRAQFIWTSDFLPAEAAEAMTPLIDEGCRAIARNLKRDDPLLSNP
jgi:hypothetical protein